MTASQAAKMIDCTPSHVRFLIRQGKLKATKKTEEHCNRDGSPRYYWWILKADVVRVRDNPERSTRGKKRT